MIPDPATDPTAAISTLSHLYSTGAFFCLGIVVVYLALRYASTHVAWLEAPGRAHWVTVALAVLAVFAIPAAQGTTPNVSMLGSAAATLLALLLPGAPPAKKAPQSGRVDGYVLAMLVMFALGMATIAFVACTHQQVVAGELAAEACGIPLGKNALQLVEGDLGKPDFEQALATDPGLVGLSIGAISCLVQTVVAVVEARNASGSAIATSALAPDPVVVNGKAWLAKHAAGATP